MIALEGGRNMCILIFHLMSRAFGEILIRTFVVGLEKESEPLSQ